jgi:hypothetical protein
VLASKERPAREQLLRYFNLRKQWESGERVAAADVVFLNACRAEMNDEPTEQQYANWRNGLLKDDEVSAAETPNNGDIQGAFLAEICGESLSVFRRPNTNYAESSDEMSSDRFSPALSPASARPEEQRT